MEGANSILFEYVYFGKQFSVSDESLSQRGSEETLVEFSRWTFVGLGVAVAAEGLLRSKTGLGPFDRTSRCTALYLF
jgi:hypothetical protein